MKSPIKLLVLDILKPHTPNIIEYAQKISGMKNMYGANIVVLEIDEKTETVKLTVEGKNIDYEKLEGIIKKLGGSVHSIDKVATGKRIVKEAQLPKRV